MSRVIKLAFVLPVTALSFACSSSDGPHDPPVLTNAIVFVSTRSGSAQIEAMNTDGSNPRPLTQFAGDKEFPDVSPDGKHIAFSAETTDSTFAIFVMNADGSGLTRLTHGRPQCFHPSWSGDGTQITYTSYPSDNAEIFVMNSDGSMQTNITNNDVNDNHPSWSRTSNVILFDSFREPPGENPAQIYTMTSAGGSPTQVAIGEDPSWSPSGDRFVFIGWNGDIWVSQTPDGSTVTDVATSAAFPSSPRWSGNGSEIAYTLEDVHGLNPQVWVMNADGSDRHALTSDADGENYSPTFTAH